MKKSASNDNNSAANDDEYSTEYEIKGIGKVQESTKSGMRVIAQYVKNYSIENPYAPNSLHIHESPNIDLNVNLVAGKMGNSQRFEVVLQFTAKATHSAKELFNIELSYAGVFEFHGLSDEEIHPLVFIECPRLLFPFAREILADSTRNAGFPPLLLNPIDFAEMYRLKSEQKKQQESEGKTLH